MPTIETEASNSASRGRTALIVGAGIGGLSAGIALRQAGWRVRIFERAESPRELGFGVGLAPHAIAALRELGLADRVLARCFEPRCGGVRRMDGTVLKRVALPPEALGEPMVMALRPALHGTLLEAVGTDAISLGRDATGLMMTGDRVTLHMADGDTAEGDLLVGADGIGSVVRRTLHPTEPPPRSRGIVVVRGAVHGALHHLGDLSAVCYLGGGVESMLVRASETGIYWYISLARTLVPSRMRDPADILTLMLPGFDETFRAVTSATVDLRYDELVDRDPIPFWGRNAVTLLGDAAHPLLLHTGQGAAQAIVDAGALARALDDELNIERALRAYERDRIPKTAALLTRGRRTARVMRTTNRVASYLREVILRFIPVNTLARVLARIARRAGTGGARAENRAGNEGEAPSRSS